MVKSTKGKISHNIENTQNVTFFSVAQLLTGQAKINPNKNFCVVIF
jgi:hypothetical protein